MDLKELRIRMMKTKKTDPEVSKVLSNILSKAQLIAKDDKNRDVTEDDIVQAAKKENKMALESKSAGAPFNEKTFEVCAEFLPTLKSEDETREIINELVSQLPDTSKKQKGRLMGVISKQYTDIDRALAAKIIDTILT